MLGEDALHLDRVDVLPTGDDHVLDPVGDVDVAVVVHVAAVAGVHPAAAQRLGGLLGPVPVAEHHVAAADDDLADLAAGQLDVVRADDAHLVVRQRPAGGAAPRGVLVVFGQVAGGGGGQFGHPVELGELRVGERLERAAEHAFGHGGGAVGDPPDAG